MTTPLPTKSANLERDESLGSSTDSSNQVMPVSRASTAAEIMPRGPRMTKGRQIGIIATCTLAMMNNMGNGPSFTVALPDIAKDLGIEAANIQWVISAYSLTACFLLLWGVLADIYGRRLVYLLATLWTGAWGIGCGFAPTEVGLDVMRGLQGLGPAAVLPACMGILAQTFEEGSPLRTVAFATFSSGAPIGAALGNVLSGFLTQWTGPGWKSALWAQAGLSFLTTAMGLYFIPPDHQTHLAVPEGHPPRSTKGLWRIIDWFGIFLISGGLVLIVFCLGYGETAKPSQWSTAYIIVLLILGVLMVVAFVFWEARLGGWPSEQEARQEVAQREKEAMVQAEQEATARGEVFEAPVSKMGVMPLLNLSLFTRGNGALSAMLAIAFFVWAGFTGWIFFAVLYYQQYQGLGPVLQMIRMLPMTGAGLFANITVAYLVPRIHGLIIVIIGCTFTSIAPLLFAVIDTHKTYWSFGFVSAIFSVFGSDYIFVSGSLLVAKVSHPSEQSLAGGVFFIVTQIGTSVGLSLASIVLDRTLAIKARQLGYDVGSGGDAVNNAPPAAYLFGLRNAQWLNFAYCMIGLAIGLIWLRHIGIVAPEAPSNVQKKVEDAEAPVNEKREQRV